MQVGDAIGPYRLLEILGEGGMGTVFLAEQREPVRRRVALKLVKPGMDSRQVLARFEQERQALALMDHPNIARVFDAGTTEGGQPYFVMELVHGVPITDYCDQERLPLPERLELFLPVCAAVQHAHQKGVIHRDLKPQNVLVSLVDGRPTPKVIDFGVAKAMHGGLTDLTVHTELGMMVGTIGSMAPEQADPTNVDVDTRADVYSLGVLLYELLTGVQPFPAHELRKEGLVGMLRILREVEPERPSTRVTTAADVERIAARRGLPPDRLARGLHGDLDWIVLKCLAKERQRRYDSAAALAQDLERHLGDEPVLARPPSAGYRARKWIARNRVAFVAAVTIAVLLVAATTTSLALAARARRESERARVEVAITRQVDRFLREDLLAQASPFAQSTVDPRLEVRTVLDRASERVAGRFDGEPLVEASVRETIARSYWGLGLFDKAAPHFERALDLRRRAGQADGEETLEAWSELGYAIAKQGEPERGEAMLAEALEAQRRALGPDAVRTLQSELRLADLRKDRAAYSDAEALVVRVLERLSAGGQGDGELALQARDMLATLLSLGGRSGEALPHYEEAIAASRRLRGPDHPGTLGLRSRRSSALFHQGRHADAEREQRELLEDMRRALGPDSRLTLEVGLNLAMTCAFLTKLADAESHAQDAVERSRRALGSEELLTLRGEKVLAQVYLFQDRIPEALPILTRVAAEFRERFGASHLLTQETESTLGVVYMQTEDFARAEPLFAGLLAATRERLGERHPMCRTMLQNLAIALDGQGKLAEAEARWLEVLDLCAEGDPAAQATREGALSSLGRNRLKQGKHAEAEAPLRECLTERTRTDPDGWRRFNAESLLGGSLLGQGRAAEAEPLLLSGYRGMKEREATIDPLWKHLLPDASERVVALYEALGKPEEAARWRTP